MYRNQDEQRSVLRAHVSSSVFDRRQFKVAVLVDVLRSSSTIITALGNGARSIIPFTNLRSAIEFQRANNNVVLVGERHGVTPKGFNYNISPFDMTRENVTGKSVVYSSSNLTRILGALRKEVKIVLGGIINANAMAEYIRSLGRDVVIVACGTNQGPTVEDTAGAGAIVSSLADCDLTDDALIAVGLYKSPDWQKLVKRGRTASRLIDLGFERDVDYCLSPNLSTVVPGLVGNRITDLTISHGT